MADNTSDSALDHAAATHAARTRREALTGIKRVVLKLGSSVITSDEGLDDEIVLGLARDVCRYKASGKEFIIVSSGAIAAGAKHLSLRGGPKTIPQKQAAASVGQSRLMAHYEKAFGEHSVRVGQLLLTKDDLMHRRRYLNARNTLTTLLSWGVIPIINENDTVVVEEIELGDNDNLSALVAALAEADLLITLTDSEGFMDCDPHSDPNACVIPLIEEITPALKRMATGSVSGVGRGGMQSKLDAAVKAGMAGVPMIIARGKEPRIIEKILEMDPYGTLILPSKERISARKHWMRYNLVPEGALIVDRGAADALIRGKKSLLPIGVIDVHGRFEHGAAVGVKTESGDQLAVGLVNYSSDEIGRIKGRQTVELSWVLGYTRGDELIHADNLVPIENGSNSPR